ncbi:MULTISPECIES: hypothetical protein [Pseudomonas]|uniref:Uncharacterized protein n=2 Tax=Pseudomonas TaxID=286 RepID=A0A2X2FD61_PSELU|nr:MULTISPECIES: hypothetical protein [Pseudomonas]SPZ16730.1 Uncharacterised protein [Pseudomonas luteola]
MGKAFFAMTIETALGGAVINTCQEYPTALLAGAIMAGTGLVVLVMARHPVKTAVQRCPTTAD